MNRNRLKISTIFIFSVFFFNISAQDSIAIKNLIDSSNKYTQIDFDIAITFAQEALNLSKNLNYQKGIGISYYQFGNINLNMANYTQSENFLLKALEIFSELKIETKIISTQNRLGWLYVLMAEYGKVVSYSNKALNNPKATLTQKAISLNNIATSYYYIGNYTEALNIYLKALKIHQKTENQKGIVYTYNNIAVIHLIQENYQKTLEYYTEAYHKLKKLNDDFQIPAILNNIGAVFLQTKQYDSALFYYNMAYDLGIQVNNKSEIARITSNLSILYKNLEKYNIAIDFILQSINYYTQLDNKTGLSICYATYSEILLLQGDINKAIKNALLALDYAEQSNSFQEKTQALNQLAEMYAQIGLFEKAYVFLNNYTKLNDSLYDIEKLKVIENMTMVYETEKNEQKIELLETNEKLKDLQLKKRKIINFILLSALAVFIILVVILLKTNSKLNTAYKGIVEKTEEIIQQEEQIAKNSIDKTVETLSEKEIFIYNELEKQINENKIFTTETLTLDELSKIINTNRNILSKIINQKYQTNFNNLINQNRVKEACRLISQNKHENYTLEAISKNVGFNSRSTFNSAFKKFVGVTPSFYINSISKKH
ncbi:MAG: tetratricopeptide repeat protein [Bacteroidales bacterium]|nr:tetratricopeptide repeat protein [Bacteroidales bacterium]